MSIFEAVMLLCFGAAWPFSIYKSFTSKQTAGKSVMFLFTILIGYVSGVIHKLTHTPDLLTTLYVLNGTMVVVDIALYYRNKKLQPEEKGRVA